MKKVFIALCSVALLLSCGGGKKDTDGTATEGSNKTAIEKSDKAIIEKSAVDNTYINHGEEYKVPSVHGKELAEAAGILESKKLDYKIIKREYSGKVADNVVLQMYPDSGSVVKEGRKIGLVLSTTVKPRKTIPSVIDNRTFREAESHIKAAGFNIERVDTINGEKDWVYEVRYKRKPLVNGDAIPEGSNVVVVIGNGEKVVEEGNVEFDDSFDI